MADIVEDREASLKPKHGKVNEVGVETQGFSAFMGVNRLDQARHVCDTNGVDLDSSCLRDGGVWFAPAPLSSQPQQPRARAHKHAFALRKCGAT